MTTAQRYARAAAVAALIALAVGCGGGSAKQAKVSGKVTVDGAPLPTGVIIFEGVDGKASTSIDIKDGAYAGETTVGKKVIRISSQKEFPPDKSTTGGMTGGEYDKPQLRETLPLKYNADSKETKDVVDGANSFDFTVSKK